MADEQVETLTGGSGKREETLEKLRPTLFIGVGGTGMEVLLRVRRHIVNALWGSGSNRVRVDSLSDFPVAQFINFDLAVDDIIESDKSQKQDSIYELVKFTDEERIAETFDIKKYSRDDDSLSRFSHIQSWSPLTPIRLRELGIDPSKGAGQIRAISRLYFFDKYRKTRDQIRVKLLSLKSGLSKDQQLKHLGLEIAPDKFKIVIICSIAGGTGSGSFLDMGWLANWVASTSVKEAEVELVAFMPSGFQTANKDATEANGYAALMELETAMLGEAVGRYITKWDPDDRPPTLEPRPFSEVYLVDTGNVAELHTSDVKDIYQMVADSLFEGFASADFANRKRSVAVNQRKPKIGPFSPRFDGGRYQGMKLTYFKGYSAFGQAILDTQQTFRRDMRANVWAGEMLKSFFGVGARDSQANRATDKQRDAFMADLMELSVVPFSNFPEFSSKNVELKLSSGDFADYRIVEDLLRDKQGDLVAGMQQKVDDRIEGIKSGFKRDEWVAQVREVVKQLERDAIRDPDSTADVVEDRVTQQSTLLITRLKERVREQLYAYLDNQEFGGLEYVLSLVEQIKDRLANSSTGLISQLASNAARYEEIREAVRTHEYERLMGNLAQAKGGLFGSGEKQSLVIMDQLKTEIANFLKFHLRAKAAHESAELMSEFSRWLGERTGVDPQGRPTWNGLVGEFQSGREAVVEMIGSLQHSIETLKQDLKKDHATYIQIEAPHRDVPLPKAELLRDWADESFKDIGGSKVLFQMLAQPEDRASLLSKVKRMAERQIAVASNGGGGDRDGDPLVAALEDMSPSERHRRFTELIARAMPWIDANLSREFMLSADQYKCFIGVSGASEFEKRFRAEIDTCVPTRAGITPGQIKIVDTGVPGRAVCYCELSGIPLTVLRGLEPWRASYRKESEKIPVHTHIDSTLFAHPLVPTTDELNALSDDFKSFILAVMLGVLVRSPQKLVPPGQYQFTVRPGETLRMGNERSFRKNGLPTTRREQIINRVNDKIDALGKYQMATLAVLADYYDFHVYAAKKVVIDEAGTQEFRKGLAGTLAGEVAKELTDRVLRKGLSQREFERVKDRALERLSTWAAPIEGSESDAYEWEVGDADAETGPRLKYVVRKELFQENGDDALAEVLGLRAMTPKSPEPLPVNVALGAPPPPSATQYMLAINGQQAGPYTQANIQQFLASGQINQLTLVWRQGMSTWLPLGQVPELAVPPPLPGGIPPLPGGAPPLPGSAQ
jgi:hypothetical protein